MANENVSGALANRRPLVYLAAPYTKLDPVENTHKAIKMATFLYETGFVVPVVPHLTLLWHIVDPRPLEFWYAYDLQLMHRCEAVLRLPGASSGADAEVAAAASAEIPVFDSPDELLDWARSV